MCPAERTRNARAAFPGPRHVGCSVEGQMVQVAKRPNVPAPRIDPPRAPPPPPPQDETSPVDAEPERGNDSIFTEAPAPRGEKRATPARSGGPRLDQPLPAPARRTGASSTPKPSAEEHGAAL